jgi:hypothetical protein
MVIFISLKKIEIFMLLLNYGVQARRSKGSVRAIWSGEGCVSAEELLFWVKEIFAEFYVTVNTK